MRERRDSRTRVLEGATGTMNPESGRADEAICEIKGLLQQAKRVSADAARKIDALRDGRPETEITKLHQAYHLLSSVTENLNSVIVLVDVASKELEKSD